MSSCIKNITDWTLARVAQWIGCRPQTSSVPGQGACLCHGPGAWLGTCERRLTHVSLAHRCFSPSLSPSLPLSLKNKSLLKNIQIDVILKYQ